MKLQGKNGSMILAGRLIKDPETKKVGNKGWCKTTMVIADQREEPLVTAVAWYELGEECARFRKGDRVLVAGTMQSREYNGKTYEDLALDFALKQSLGVTAAEGAAADEFSDVTADDCPFF